MVKFPSTCLLILLSGFPWASIASHNGCASDSDCRYAYTYCNSRKVCVNFRSDYCNRNSCGLGDADCDPGDIVGCESGLVCGVNNCAKFHRLGSATGINAFTDCCERRHELPRLTGLCHSDRDCAHDSYCDSGRVCSRRPPALYPACTAHSQCSKDQFCGTECRTGACGADGTVSRGTKRNYCQPCGECQAGGDSVTGSCKICNFAGPCGSDPDCAPGSYCTSKGVCTRFNSEYCDSNSCGLGDADCDANDAVGCESGLVCGVNNCAKFHDLGSTTGISANTDCCEVENPGCKEWCSRDNTPLVVQCTWKDCRLCPSCPGDVPGCEFWCIRSKVPLAKKCNFKDCLSCPGCPNSDASSTTSTQPPERTESRQTMANIAPNSVAGECQAWCEKFSLPWTRKCEYTTCRGCPACSNEDKVTPAQRSDDDKVTPAQRSVCKASCADKLPNWSKKCGWRMCGGCPECASQQQRGEINEIWNASQSRGDQTVNKTEWFFKAAAEAATDSTETHWRLENVIVVAIITGLLSVL